MAFPPYVENKISMRMSSSDREEPRKRRKRKDGRNVQAMSAEENVVDKVEEARVEIAKAEPLQMQVADIRDVVSGKVPTPEQAAPEVQDAVVDDELEDDEEYEYYYEDENNNEVIVGTSGTQDNSLESLLADARKIRSEDTEEEEEDDSSIKKQIRGVLSNIVTADFFVVCALLAWFLAGIFCSYIIKDDTVQIAFNGIFEPVVQPALGILMIGSAAGAAFDDSEEEL